MEAHPVDQARWVDLVELFGPSGGTRGCWCMARRLPAATVAANGSAENRAALESFVEASARIVEAYPVKAMPGDPGRGVLSTFLAAGFTTYAEDRTTAKRNVVVRRSL